jgi:hypothetical protein
MILSKAALQVVLLCSSDKHVPILNCICIEPDGSVVATNGKAVVAISPAEAKIIEAVPLPGKSTADCYGQQIVLSADTVKEIIRAIPRDTQFKGLLEHCSVNLPDSSLPTVKVIVTDGKRKSEITVRRMKEKFVDYRQVFKNAFAAAVLNTQENINRVIVNRKRWGLICDVIDKVCPYDGDFSPVYWEFAHDGNILVRAENELTKQRLVAVFSSVDRFSGGQDNWMDLSNWELKLLRKSKLLNRG